jgi:membrane protease YdiL (CAAX protease family)
MGVHDHNDPEQSGPSPGLPSTNPAAGPVPIVRAAVQFYALLLAAAMLWTFWLGDSLFFRSPADAVRGIRIGADFALGIAAAAVVIGFSEWLTRRTRLGRELAAALTGVLGRRSPVECIVLALASGFAEEAFFRGALQPQVGLVIASLIFGVVHFVPRREFLPWTAFAIAAGFLFGWLFDTTGNLVAPVVAHASINAVNLWLLSNRDG